MKKGEEKIDLKMILEATNADAALLVDDTGSLESSINVEFDTNIALMTEMAFKMCDDLSEDLDNGGLDQMLAKSSKGFFIANKLHTGAIIILITNDNSKIGLFMKYMNSLKIN